jgi:quercetin dioxygenase-like cupin family protein
MAYPGQTLENPASGERITFRTTAAETTGELVAVDLELPRGARVPGGLHSHPLQEERFEVVKGTMRFRLRRERIIAGPGTVVVVPPGIQHDFANGGDEDALVRVEIRPALKMEQLFETAVTLAQEGRTMRKGIPKPLDLALFTREFEQEVQAAFPPLWMQRLALAPLAWLAKPPRPRNALRLRADSHRRATRDRTATGCMSLELVVRVQRLWAGPVACPPRTPSRCTRRIVKEELARREREDRRPPSSAGSCRPRCLSWPRGSICAFGPAPGFRSRPATRIPASRSRSSRVSPTSTIRPAAGTTYAPR